MSEQSQENARFDALFSRGTELLRSGDAKKAAQLLERAVKLEPTHSDATLNLGGAYILSKQFKKAVPLLVALSGREAENEMVWTNLGAAYLGNPILATDEQQQSAIASFEKALALNPVAPNVAYNIGLIYRDRRELEQSVNWFKRALQANPNDKDARNLIVRLEKEMADDADQPAS